MPTFRDLERKPLIEWLKAFQGMFSATVVGPLYQEIPYERPPSEISSLLERLNTAAQEIGKQAIKDQVVVDDAVNPILRLIILRQRRVLASQLNTYRNRTLHSEIIEDLANQLLPLDVFMGQDWFRRADVVKAPRLADFLTPKRMEEMGYRQEIHPRQYDEKFHILQAPSLLIPDLNYYRETCGSRGRSVVLAFLDIDYFKQFNTEYTESVVDRDVLPVFMRTLEAFAFARGHAYRQGGDEYLLLLPSLDLREAANALDSLRQRIQELTYRAIDKQTTVSIGFVVIDPDCFLTEREAEERSNWAKNYAKQKGRNRIAWCAGPLFGKEDLCLFSGN